MAEVRGSEWLPQGWKVEVRVRKTGRKDRYYTDPESGLVFRSLRDIDRYLLTGKLGRHVVKPKPNAQILPNAPADASMEKDSNSSDGSEKNPARNGPKKPVCGGTKSNHKSKNRKISKPPHNKGLNPCFKLDPGLGNKHQPRSLWLQESHHTSRTMDKKHRRSCAKATGGHDLPNLPEIIESVRKCEDSGDSMYLSAQDIAALLGRQNQNGHEVPAAREAPPAASNSAAPIRTDPVLDQKRESDTPSTLSYTDICSDPCIEFAIKTLTGVIPVDGALKDPMVGDLP